MAASLIIALSGIVAIRLIRLGLYACQTNYWFLPEQIFNPPEI